MGRDLVQQAHEPHASSHTLAYAQRLAVTLPRPPVSEGERGSWGERWRLSF